MSNNARQIRPQLTSIDSIISHFAKQRKRSHVQTYCLQIGANDGKTNDPLHAYFRDYGWKGLLIEPQADVFQNELTKTYAHNTNVLLANVALAGQDGELPFYRVAISKARWATGLSSFDLKSLRAHLASGYILRKAQEEGVVLPANEGQFIEEVKVPAMTVESLFRRYQISHFDLLCIDTEGFDYQILKLLDFKKYKPELVLFESKNLCAEDYIEAKKLLIDAGYKLFWEKGDTLAIRFKIPLWIKMISWFKAFIRKI